MNEPIYITTPPGRFVMGDAFTGSDKDHQGRPRLDQKGQPKTQWFMGIAIPKNDPGWAEMWGQIVAVAQRDFPAGEWQRQDFAWKVYDGDGLNREGKPYPDHQRGCYVVRFSSGFAPTVYNAQNQQIVDPSQCKRGDYVRCYLSVRGNDDRQKPGVYVNHQMVQVVGYGAAINTGPDAATVFGQPAALPPGASATPVAGAPMPAMPGQPPQQPGTYAPQPAPVPGYQPPAAPAGAYPPQQAQPAYPTAPAQPGPTAPGGAQGYAAAPGYAMASPSNPQQQPAPYPQILNGPTQ